MPVPDVVGAAAKIPNLTVAVAPEPSAEEPYGKTAIEHCPAAAGTPFTK